MKLSDTAKEAMFTCGIPEYMHDGIVLYVEERIAPGSFLTAVLENDLLRALGKADSTNINALKAYGMWLYNHCPIGIYGSVEAVNKHLSGETA